MCFPLLPVSLARSGSRSRLQRLIPLAICRSVSRLLPKARQFHKFSPSRASRALADPLISLAERLKGSRNDWLLLAAGGRHAAGVHGPREGRGPGGGARALASGVLVWIFFFFPRKKFALATPQGCRLLLPPPPSLGAHLWVQIAKLLSLREVQNWLEPESRPPGTEGARACVPWGPTVAKRQLLDLVTHSPRL